MIEERFESYVYQIMQYVKYQENKPYIESILEEMRYTLFREDRNYIKQLEQENKQLKELYRKTCEHLFNIGNDELARYFQAQINECPTFTTQILGDKENEKER